MRTKNFLKHLIMGAMLLATGKVASQVTTASNVAVGPTDFLGWDNTFPTNNFPLVVKHELNQPIQWFTDAVQRMMLNPTTSYTINSGFGAQNATGFLGLSPNATLWTSGPGPFSRLHMSDGTSPQASSHRPWMKNGITLTGNQDHGYMGQKAGAVDETDMILHWSDNPGESLKDRMRFIFTSGYNSIYQTGAQSEEGLEAMRFWPADLFNVNVGIGDFAPAGVGDPTERLDMMNERLTVRQIPPTRSSCC